LAPKAVGQGASGGSPSGLGLEHVLRQPHVRNRALKTRPGLVGVALGLLINAAILLAFDLFAERGGAEYLIAIADSERSG
jgi:hypothetical protein